MKPYFEYTVSRLVHGIVLGVVHGIEDKGKKKLQDPLFSWSFLFLVIIMAKGGSP